MVRFCRVPGRTQGQRTPMIRLLTARAGHPLPGRRDARRQFLKGLGQARRLYQVQA